MGQPMMAKNFGSGSAWIPRVLIQQIGPLTYVIDVSEGRLWKHHVDHMKEYAMPRPCPEQEDIGNNDTTPATTEPVELAVGPPEFLPQDGSETRVGIKSNGESPLLNLPPNVILPDLHSPVRNAISDPSPPRRSTPYHSPAG